MPLRRIFMVKIIVDCFGGDKSPDANIEGAVSALKNFEDLYIIFTGDEKIINEKLLPAAEKEKIDITGRYEIVHAPDVVDCNDKPTDAIRLKKESSMVKAITLLRESDDIAGMVSTGSTGTLVTGATLRVGRLRNVMRPAFCPVLPTMNGGVVGICDSGANVDCKPEYLQQFAIMGSLYMKVVFGVENPRVGLLNIGTESEKGDELRKTVYGLLENTPGINFTGNMEARDLLKGNFDLVVCDGFAGNVLIKTTEGACLEMLKRLKKDIYSRFIYKFGALFMRKMFADEKEFMNYQNYGGSIMLGTKKTVVKGHGSSNATAVEKCIEQVYKTQTGSLCELIESSMVSLFGTPEEQ
jgi:glycerol-3-phosphate acyltransferase PlsX